MNLAIIPARGGSKRIPGKNFKPFHGKPLICYSIDVALKSGLFDKVMVSTDSDEIKQIALEYGAEAPFMRPEHLSNDICGTRPVTNHAIEFCKVHFFEPENVCCIYATAPFLEGSYLKKGLKLLQENPECRFTFSATTFPFPVQRALIRTEQGVKPMWPEFIYHRSQDLEEALHDAGQFYWGNSEAWLSGTPVFSSTSTPVVLPRHLVQDIDTEEDWIRAELMYRAYVGNSSESKSTT